MKSDFLSIDQVHEQFGFSKSWLYKQCASRKLRHYKPANRIYFKREDLEQYIEHTRVMTARELQSLPSNSSQT